MGKTNASRAPITWPVLIGAGICFLVGVMLIYRTAIPVWWLLLLLLALPISLVLLMEGCRFFSQRRCATCGFRVSERLSDFDQCPRCEGLFGDADNLMPQQQILHLTEYFSEVRPTAMLIVMVVAIAIRDGASEIRLAGRDDEGELEYPDETPGRFWRIWLSVKGHSFELAPPPRHLGAEAYRLLQEIHRRTAIDAAPGPACFQIAIDNYSESVELVVEESEEEKVAKIVFTSESLKPWAGMQPYLTEISERASL